MLPELATFEQVTEQANLIKASLPYLNNLPADTAELVDGLILRLEVAHARGLQMKLEREAKQAAEGVLEREAEAARREAKVVAEKAKAAKAAAPKGKQRGKTVVVEVEPGHHVVVKPGLSIRLYGLERNRIDGPVDYDRTFEIGDTVAMDSYNMVYMGQITSIGAKTVTIKGSLGTKRLNLERFSWRNRLFDVEETARRNAVERNYL